ncbi:hypothetical protein D3C76_916220 [compost metagenome]
MQRHAHQAGRAEHHADARGIAQSGGFQRQIAFECRQQRQAFLLIGHQVTCIERTLSSQHPRDTAEMPGAKLSDRVIRVLARNFLQRTQLFIHRKAGRVAVIKNIVRQHAQASRDRLGIPAQHCFGVAALYQFLHLLRMMQAD